MRVVKNRQIFPKAAPVAPLLGGPWLRLDRLWRLALAGLLTIAALACGGDPDPSSVIDPRTDLGGGGTVKAENTAPELHKIGKKVAVVGQELIIVPKATDLDNDTLTYSAYGAPPGSWTANPPRFVWTPTAFIKPFNITFFVSDGIDNDREKVQISVTTEATNHPPSFQSVGDQVIEVGQQYFLQLQASDPDGDPLTYGLDGEAPDTAALNAQDGTFVWTPHAPDKDTTRTLIFTASDGISKATLPVVFYVIPKGANKPPSFAPIGPQVASVGEAWSLTVTATDPESDPLTYAAEDLPAGAVFDAVKHRLVWTPTDAQLGTHTVRFTVTDGSYSAFTQVNIDVIGGGAGQCTDDNFEPNNEPTLATPLTAGDYTLSMCDTDFNPVDQDWFSIGLAAGQTLSVTATFAHADGDLDMTIANLTNPAKILAKADSSTDNEVLNFAAPSPGTYLIRVYGTGAAATFKMNYTLTLSTQGLNCDDDDYENNDSMAAATPITPGEPLNPGQYCPADLDYYTFEIQCGQTMTATLSHDPAQGNLDLLLFRESDTSGPVVTSATAQGTETVSFAKAPLTEALYVLVRGAPPESVLNSYQLETTADGFVNCSDDSYEPNDSKLKATPIPAPSGQLDGLVSCCNRDWYFVPLKQGEGLLGVISVTLKEGVRAWLYEPDGTTPIGQVEADLDGLFILLELAPFSGNYYLVVEGPPGNGYSVEMEVLENSGCSSSKACEGGKVCKLSTGQCVPALCETSDDCPTGQEMPCVNFQCLPGCTYAADCKLSEACKGFAIGKYCGETGGKAVGEACFSYTACAGSSACHFQDLGGYCTMVGCQANADCQSGDCVAFDSTTLCARHCTSNSDCRVADGYTCQDRTLPNSLPTTVCLPIP